MLKKVALISLALCFVASVSSAMMILDLRVADGTKAVTIDHVGQVVILEIWGSPEAGHTLSAVFSSAMRLTSDESASNALWGDIAGVAKNPLFLQGSNGVAKLDYDANPDAEWGGAFPTLSNTGYLNVANSTAIATTGDTIRLATLTWTATKADLILGGTSNLNVVPFISSSTGQQNFKYTYDGLTVNNTAANKIGLVSGDPVVMTALPIPEPSTLILLGMGALALVFIRRRK